MEKKNTLIYYIKSFAIISVICAHCNFVSETASDFCKNCSLILQNLGTAGVGCFFVISGYLFHYKSGKCKDFFHKKFNGIVIPWIISATIVYLYVYLRKPPLTVAGWLNFVVGNGSYCYYLTVLLILYFIFYILPFMRTEAALCICGLIGVMSSVWFYQIGSISPYLNVFNWIGFFSVGYYFQKNKELFEKIKVAFLKTRVIWLFAYLAVIAFQVFQSKGGSYWGGINSVFSWCGSLALISFATFVSEKRNQFSTSILNLGKDSFAIYIWHMPIAGIVAYLMSKGVLSYFVLARPLFVALFTEILLLCAKRIILKLKLNKFAKFIGIDILG